MKAFKLGSDNEIPALGLGTWNLKDDVCINSVVSALEIGYRHIDTADGYGNHREVAQGIAKSGLKREDLFITTKVPRVLLEHDQVIESAKRYLDELNTSYIDLLLIHWPNPDIPVQETLSAMQELKDRGLIKSIGVSNFSVKRLEDALSTGIEFHNNQVEFHPSLNQKKLKDFCDSKEIVITAYSPLARGDEISNEALSEIAKKYNKTTAQVILNWLINKNIVAIPASTNPDHIKENFEIFDWDLESEDMEKIDNLGGNNRTVNPGFALFDD